jgi:F-type H+-transporting ATPase subunit c
MWQLDSGTIVTLITIMFAVGGIVLGSIIPALMEGKAVQKALEGMTRQPDAANDLRTTLLISMALLESTAIYSLLVVLILIFGNPLITRFFG